MSMTSTRRRRQAATAAPSCVWDDTTYSLWFRDDKGQRESKIAIVKTGCLEFIWFEIFPIMLHIGYRSHHATYYLDKMSNKRCQPLKNLLAMDKQCCGTAASDLPPTALVSFFVSESGLAEVLFHLNTDRARLFQDEIYGDILPRMRRARSLPFPSQEDALFVTMRSEFKGFRNCLLAEFGDMLETDRNSTISSVKSTIECQMSGFSDHMLGGFTSLLASERASLAKSICGCIANCFNDVKDVVLACNPTGLVSSAVQSIFPAPARESTSICFPMDQLLSEREQVHWICLSGLVIELLGKESTPLTFGAWEACRNMVGSRCLAMRKDYHNSKQPILKPLLWKRSAITAKKYYVFLNESRADVSGNCRQFVRKVLKQKMKKNKTTTVEEHIRYLIRVTPPKRWPAIRDDAEMFEVDESEMIAALTL